MYDLHALMTILMSCSILFSTKVAPSRSDTRTFLRCFTEGSRKSHGRFQEVSWKSHGRFQEHFRNLSRNYLDPGSFLEYGMFPGRFQECSRKVPGTIWIQETGNRKQEKDTQGPFSNKHPQLQYRVRKDDRDTTLLSLNQ